MRNIQNILTGALPASVLPACVARLVLAALVVIWGGCQSRPPRESGPFRKVEFVEVVRLDPTIHLDLRYATTNNFMHRAMYHRAIAVLQKPAAEALVRVQGDLRTNGYGLLIYDAYRPWSVTREFWEAATPYMREKEFVANPRKGSRHNRGCAVDLTLYELSTGLEVVMPSGFDEFSPRAFPTYSGGSPESRANRELLRRTMERHGFTVLPEEWWHFDFNGWKEYPVLDVPLEELRVEN